MLAEGVMYVTFYGRACECCVIATAAILWGADVLSSLIRWMVLWITRVLFGCCLNLLFVFNVLHMCYRLVDPLVERGEFVLECTNLCAGRQKRLVSVRERRGRMSEDV